MILVTQVKAGGIDFSVASATLWTEELVVCGLSSRFLLSLSPPACAVILRFCSFSVVVAAQWECENL